MTKRQQQCLVRYLLPVLLLLLLLLLLPLQFLSLPLLLLLDGYFMYSYSPAFQIRIKAWSDSSFHTILCITVTTLHDIDFATVFKRSGQCRDSFNSAVSPVTQLLTGGALQGRQSSEEPWTLSGARIYSVQGTELDLNSQRLLSTPIVHIIVCTFYDSRDNKHKAHLNIDNDTERK
ncbi:MAG: hypothetical protein J3Q66DRAFT_159342 [Benniella sp.]|nr:MAG: hypothetical protein J3Q66DRAFT_159342 [Benniella sp.]